jgi:hypothetical protein
VSALTRLYPQPWRDRYEAEFLDLLESRPPGLRDRVDILLGAVDARVNPEVPGTALDDGSVRRGRQRAGLAAIVGGLLWVAVAIVVLLTPVDPADGYKDGTAGLVIGLVASLLTAVGAFLATDLIDGVGQRGRAIAIAIFVASLLFVAPWPILAAGVLGSWLLSSAYGFVLGAAGHRIGLALAISGLLATGANLNTSGIALVVPLGLAWMGFGVALLAGRRAVARRSDPPAPTRPAAG